MKVTLKEVEMTSHARLETGWYEWFLLHLYDDEAKQEIPEGFFILAASDKITASNIYDKKKTNAAILTMPTGLNEKAVYDHASKLINKMQLTDWDSFYKNMSAYFIYDESY